MFQFIRRWLGLSSPPPPPASTPAKKTVSTPVSAASKPDHAKSQLSQTAQASPEEALAGSARLPAAPAPVSAANTSAASAPVGTSSGVRIEAHRASYRDPERDLDRPSLGVSHRKAIGSWAYLLQDIDVAKIAKLDVDLMVVDYSVDGSDARAFDTAAVSRMKGRPSGKRVIAYMSIGEAESYRYYWRKEWKGKERKPAWLDHENPDWDENYKVHYWDPGWQRVIFGSPQSYLDRIIAAGFDGAYLDIIDAYEYYEKKRPSARQDMIDFVTALATYARQKRSDFMIIPQNGEALLQSAPYRSVISAFAKEDLYYGVKADEKANTVDETQTSLGLLDLARKDAIPIMVVEYLDDSAKIRKAYGELTRLGYTAYFAPRELDGLRETPPVRQA
jgi:cysteinyl-tRNA synthetase, unknown class